MISCYKTRSSAVWGLSRDRNSPLKRSSRSVHVSRMILEPFQAAVTNLRILADIYGATKTKTGCFNGKLRRWCRTYANQTGQKCRPLYHVGGWKTQLASAQDLYFFLVTRRLLFSFDCHWGV